MDGVYWEEHQSSKQHQFSVCATREHCNCKVALNATVTRAARQTKSFLLVRHHFILV